jgi:putative ABC transport system permease protein
MIATKLAMREIKNNKRYWLFFTANLCIGLMGFTFIHLFRSNITKTLDQRAKTILSSDMAISGRRQLSTEEGKNVDDYLLDKITRMTEIRELYSMGKSSPDIGSKSRLTFIKAIKDKYPLIGEITLTSGKVLDESFILELQKKPYVIISKEVQHQLKVKKGDSLYFGDQKFEVVGTIESDSTSSLRGVSLAPKVYIGDIFLDKTNLIKFGTLAWYTRYYLLKDDSKLDIFKTELYKKITDPAISVQTPESSSEQVGRVVNYLSDYLGLIGIVALLISCVGGSYLFQSYVFDRLRQIGILKSIGVSKAQLINSFLIIITSFGLLATALALLFSNLLLPLAMIYFKEWVNFDLKTFIDLEAVGIILSIGIVTNLLICFPILDRVFQAQTIDLLNNKITTKLSIKDYALYLPALLFLWGLSVWQAKSLMVGSVFVAAMFIIFFVVLMIMPFVLKWLSNILIHKDLTWPVSLNFGYGFRLVTRNKISTLLTILCMSMGVSLLSVIGQLDKTLKNELIGNASEKPSLFLFDIQQEQYKDLKKFANENNVPLKNPSPMIRARLIKKNGEKIKRKVKQEGFTTNENERKRRFNNRGINLSYAEGLNPSEKMVEGSPFTGRYSGEGVAQVSLEKRYAQRMEVEVGDTLTYEVLGIEVTGKIVNLRTVNWSSFLPNFFITFQPGVLEEAPKTYLSSVSAVPFEKQLEIQDQIVEKFPNISILNVTEIISKIMTMFSAMAFAVGIMSLCCISVGMFVLYSILQSQLFKKQNEFALQKIIGMKEKDIFLTLFSEYFIIVITALFLGTTIGFVLAILVSQLFLDGLFVVNFEFFVIFNSALCVLSSIVIYSAFKTNYNKSVKELLN